MMEFRLSQPSDVTALQALWRDSFQESQDYLDLFFRTAYAPQRCMVLELESGIAGAAYWLDCSLDGKPLAYLYAVAISENHRNRGLGKHLMDAIHSHLESIGYAGALLVPGSEDARRFYLRRGYRNSCHQNWTPVEAASPVPIQLVDADAYADLRQEYLGSRGVWQSVKDLALLGKDAVFFTGEGFLGAALRSAALCPELLGDVTQAAGIAAALGMAQCTFRTEGEELPYAMVLALGGASLPEEFWFGFGFE